MFKRFGISTLAMAAAMAVAAPGLTLARDRDDRGARDFGRHETFQGRDDHDARFRAGDRFNFGVGFSAAPAPVVAPAPAARGYYDRYGVCHPYGY